MMMMVLVILRDDDDDEDDADVGDDDADDKYDGNDYGVGEVNDDRMITMMMLIMIERQRGW